MDTQAYSDKQILMLELEVNKYKDDTKSKNDVFEDSLNRAVYDVNRAMYSVMIEGKDWGNAFDWAISCGDMLHKIWPDDLKGVDAWLSIASNSLQKCMIGNEILVDGIERIGNSLAKFEHIDDADVVKILQSIKKTLNHLVYTIPAAPADISQRPQDEVVEDINHEEMPPMA